jgi:GNAT superfamily N-acetyltransferase
LAKWFLIGSGTIRRTIMSHAINLRLLTPNDLEFAESLRALAGWNQTRRDWQRLLAYQPDGCFVAEFNGSSAGTATTTCYGDALAWIGMVLVHPDFRRQGLGRALLEHCLHSLADRKIRCIKLDATPLGKPLYHQLGFQEEWTLTRWEWKRSQLPMSGAPDDPRDGAANLSAEKSQKGANELAATAIAPHSPLKLTAGLRLWRTSDLESLGPLDTLAFGVERHRMLEELANASCHALVHSAEEGRVDGYGMSREGMRAAYLGPIVAASPVVGTMLSQALIQNASAPQIYWDIPDANAAAVSLAEELGFVPQRQLWRMFLGVNERPGDSLLYFGIAEPAIG